MLKTTVALNLKIERHCGFRNWSTLHYESIEFSAAA
jgi:hypothetical protein